MPSLPSLPSLPALESINVVSNDAHMRISWKNVDNGTTVKMELEGEIEFTEDDTGIEWMDDNAHFEIEEKKWRDICILEVDGGMVVQGTALVPTREAYQYVVETKLYSHDELRKMMRG